MFQKITNRIFFGFSIPLFSLLFLGIIVYVNNNNNKVIRWQEENRQGIENIRAVNEISYDISRIIGSIRGYALYPGDRSYRSTYDVAREDMLKNQKELKNLISDSDIKSAIDELIKIGNEYDRVAAGVYPLVDANNLAEAKQVILIPQIAKIDELRNVAVVKLEKQIEENLTAIEKSQQFTIVVVIVGILLTIILTISAALWVALPLKKLLISLLEQIQKSGIQITTSATQIAASGKQLEATVTEQAASTNQVAATAKEISATSQQLLKTMDEVG
ncbi:MAG TPA: hypothetical protein V6D28_09935, partial [Leptolyngbyaceae cyanobacterium]